jgi:hypothetical protein
MIIDAFLVFFIIAWLREHGRAVRLEQVCRRCIDDIKRFESKVPAREESVLPVKPPPKCTMCGKRILNGTECGWITKGIGSEEYLFVCKECTTRTHAMLT